MNFNGTNTVPHLFHHNAFIILANGVDARIGTITSRFEYFNDWKRLQEEEPGVVEMETLLKGTCSKASLMDLFENFIVFDQGAGSLVKIIARNHQFLGVNRAVTAVTRQRELKGKLGVFWHTQGSGKSYSILFFVRKVHRRLGGNYTFLILTDREKADITDIIRELHDIVDKSIQTRPSIREVDNNFNPTEEPGKIYDISKIDFERLRQEFAKSKTRHTTVQNLKNALEQRLKRMLRQNPLRTDFQEHYENLVKAYNNEKERLTIEQTFAALFKTANDLDEEEDRAVREGLDQETLAVFDLLKKPDLNKREIKKIKKMATSLLDTLKAQCLAVAHWRAKEATRDAVKQQIFDFLYDETTGLPVEEYSDEEIQGFSQNVFQHVYRVYPTLPSPVYGPMDGGHWKKFSNFRSDTISEIKCSTG